MCEYKPTIFEIHMHDITDIILAICWHMLCHIAPLNE